ncbi:MAG: hypothetical protein IPN58_08195 [Anaerolineales bacterium]|nr:hypothetical protein [Anaerolineales bacterium]
MLNGFGHTPTVEETFAFIFERFEQMQAVDDEMSGVKNNLQLAQEKMDALTLENKHLNSRIQEMENSRGWKALERLRYIYRKTIGLLKK